MLQIDEKSGSVMVMNHGVEQTLNFEIDGANPQPRIIPTVARPGRVPPPANAIPPPLIRTIPTRSMRLPAFPAGPGSETPQP